jgi:hypothetical protein
MKPRITLAVLVVSISALLLSCSTTPEARKVPVAQDSNALASSVLKRVARTYSSLKSYSDSGVVYTYRDGVRESDSIRFRVHYFRPDRLKFEMTANVGSPYFPEDYTALWCNGKETYLWEQHYPHVVTRLDVTSTIAEFTGVSGRSVHNIPSLLQTNFGWQERLHEIASPTVVGEEEFDNVDCYRVQGSGRGERRFDLWIGKSDYLIRKIRTTYLDFYNDELHQGIEIDQPMSPEMLTFSPPLATTSETRKQN